MKDYVNNYPASSSKMTKSDWKSLAVCIAMAPVLGAVCYYGLLFVAWYAAL